MIADETTRRLAVLRASGEGSTGGSWDRLHGEPTPLVRLPIALGEAIPGSMVSLAELSRRRSLVVVFYRGVASGEHDRTRTGGESGLEEDARWDEWQAYEPELAEFGYSVVGVSSQSPEMHAQLALDRMLSSFVFLSDSKLLLANKLGLPTGRGPGGERVYEPLTLLVCDGRIRRVFYPLEYPLFDAGITTARIRELDV